MRSFITGRIQGADMSATVAFIGLGVMGYPMAGYLAKAGHTVRVYNRTHAKAEKWVASTVVLAMQRRPRPPRAVIS